MKNTTLEPKGSVLGPVLSLPNPQWKRPIRFQLLGLEMLLLCKHVKRETGVPDAAIQSYPLFSPALTVRLALSRVYTFCTSFFSNRLGQVVTSDYR